VVPETADHIREVDVVERALAILEEESSSWVTRQAAAQSAAEAGPASDEPPGDSG
jgi:hypothetical protein